VGDYDLIDQVDRNRHNYYFQDVAKCLEHESASSFGSAYELSKERLAAISRIAPSGSKPYEGGHQRLEHQAKCHRASNPKRQIIEKSNEDIPHRFIPTAS